MHPRAVDRLQYVIDIAKRRNLKRGDIIEFSSTDRFRGCREYHVFFQIIGSTEVVILEDADVLESMLAMEKL